MKSAFENYLNGNLSKEAYRKTIKPDAIKLSFCTGTLAVISLYSAFAIITLHAHTLYRPLWEVLLILLGLCLFTGLLLGISTYNSFRRFSSIIFRSGPANYKVPDTLPGSNSKDFGTAFEYLRGEISRPQYLIGIFKNTLKQIIIIFTALFITFNSIAIAITIFGYPKDPLSLETILTVLIVTNGFIMAFCTSTFVGIFSTGGFQK